MFFLFPIRWSPLETAVVIVNSVPCFPSSLKFQSYPTYVPLLSNFPVPTGHVLHVGMWEGRECFFTFLQLLCSCVGTRKWNRIGPSVLWLNVDVIWKDAPLAAESCLENTLTGACFPGCPQLQGYCSWSHCRGALQTDCPCVVLHRKISSITIAWLPSSDLFLVFLLLDGVELFQRKYRVNGLLGCWGLQPHTGWAKAWFGAMLINSMSL